MAQPGDHPRGVRKVGRALAVEVGEDDHLGALRGRLALEPEPLRDAVDGERRVERGGERQEAPARVGEACDGAARVDGALVHHRVGGAGGPEAHDGLARRGAEPERRTHVVARARPDERAGGEAELRRRGARSPRRRPRPARARPGAVRGRARSARVPRPSSARRGSTTRRCPRRRRGPSLPRPLSRSVRKSWGSRTARVSRRRLGLVGAQPGPAGSRERGDRHEPDSLRPLRRAAERLAELTRLGRRARVVPEDRRTQRPAVVVRHDEPVLLAGDRDGADLARPARFGERRPQRVPPHLRVGLARAARARHRMRERGRWPRPIRCRDRRAAPWCPASSSRRPRREGSSLRNSLTGGQGASSLLPSPTNCNGRSERGEMATETRVGAEAPDLTPRPETSSPSGSGRSATRGTTRSGSRPARASTRPTPCASWPTSAPTGSASTTTT